MANKPSDFDSVNPFSDYKELPPGGYVCEILNAKEEVSQAGNDMIVLMLDIVEGEQTNYFRNLFQQRKENSDNPASVKYPFDGKAYVTFTYQGKTTKKFKALCTSVEEDGKTIIWGSKFAESLKGAKIGVIFRREESEGRGDNEGKTFWNTKPYAFRSAQTIRDGDFTVPDDVPLAPSAETESNFTALSDADIPF